MNGFTGKHDDSKSWAIRKRGVSRVKGEMEEENSSYQFEIARKVKIAVEKEKSEIIEHIEGKINDLTLQLVNEITNNNSFNEKHLILFQEKSKKHKEKSSDGRGFHDKIFRARNSLLTDLFRIKHISTIYHIAIVFLINSIFNTALCDLFKLGKINLGLHLIYWNFENLSYALSIWVGMQTTTILVYFFFRFWATKRIRLIGDRSAVKFWDLTFLTLSILFELSFLIIPTTFIMKWKFSIATSFSLLMEQIRFLMKTYSFLRSNSPKIIDYKNHESHLPFPTLNKYLYFLFVPTLIYRDEYPRTSKVRWKIVFQHFAEIFGIVFCIAFLMEEYLIPSAKDFGKTKITPEQLVVTFFGNNMPCLFIFLCGFYCLLHAWLNAFAEILRFADRMFYQDWWNSSTFAEYYKTWNIVVHDWLYAFIYKDGTLMLTKRKTHSTWLVFIISAFFHEYILAFTFGFCYPILFVAFGILSTCLVLIPRIGSHASGNLMLWSSLWAGTGLCGTLYMFEYYARINCPPVTDSVIKDFFIPRSWTCNVF